MVSVRPRGGKCVVPGFGEDKPVIIQGELVAGERIVRRHIKIHPVIRVLYETVAGEGVIITEINEHDPIIMAISHVVTSEGIADRIVKIDSFPRAVADDVAFESIETGDLDEDPLVIGCQVVVREGSIERLLQVDTEIRIVLNSVLNNGDVTAPVPNRDPDSVIFIYMTIFDGCSG